MANEILGVEIRLERAIEHIEALKHESRMFMMDLPHPYGSAISDNPVGGEYIVRAKILRSPPGRFGTIAADAAHNLRAALDMIAWELAQKSATPPPESDRTTGFPIVTKPEYWDLPRTQHMIKAIDNPDAIRAIKACQPYNEPEFLRLAFVQALDNWSKHHALPSLLSFHVSRIQMVSRTWELTQFQPGAFNDGDEISRARRVDPESNPGEHYEAWMQCFVGFSKDGPGRGYPISFLEDAWETITKRVLPSFTEFFPNQNAHSSFPTS